MIKAKVYDSYVEFDEDEIYEFLAEKHDIEDEDEIERKWVAGEITKEDVFAAAKNRIGNIYSMRGDCPEDDAIHIIDVEDWMKMKENNDGK